MTGLFSTPKLPKIEDPTPLPDQEQATAARRRRVAKEVSKGANQTILSSGSRETLGG